MSAGDCIHGEPEFGCHRCCVSPSAVATLIRERDEARADTMRARVAQGQAEQQRDEHRQSMERARADAARLSVALKRHGRHDRDCYEENKLHPNCKCGLSFVTTSADWLAERDAATRDAALEEAADCFGMTADQERIRALKRGEE